MKRLAFALLLAIVSTGATAAITVVNESSLAALPNTPFTATIVPGHQGPELIVTVTVSDRTATGEHLTAAEVNFIAAQADGTVLGSGHSNMTAGNRFEWRVLVKPIGVIDGELIAQVKMTDRKIVTVELQEREAREAREKTKVATAVITVVNESSLAALPDTPFTATIVPGHQGPELVVAVTVSDRTATGEHLAEAEVNFIAAQADGTVLGSGRSDMTTGNRFEWRVLVKPIGVIDVELIAQVKMTDRKIVTVEFQEREAREKAKIARQADLKREREEREKAESMRQAVRIRERQREIAVQARRWPKHIELAVIERKVMPGMTGEQVSMAWGAPNRINETIRASGKFEQWVYSTASYVYLENGRVTAIQNSR
ncbi:MAG: hypothetical protein Q8L40_11600 [Burkholderiales bacterium]|nr:hypothetical protein [Burkholderiales bacterium]